MGSERKSQPPNKLTDFDGPKTSRPEMAGFEPRTYFCVFLLGEDRSLGQNLRIFGEKMSISTGEWMPRTALLRAVPSNSTTEPPLANNKGADFIRLKSVAPPPSHFWGSENRSLYRRGIRYF